MIVKLFKKLNLKDNILCLFKFLSLMPATTLNLIWLIETWRESNYWHKHLRCGRLELVPDLP